MDTVFSFFYIGICFVLLEFLLKKCMGFFATFCAAGFIYTGIDIFFKAKTVMHEISGILCFIAGLISCCIIILNNSFKLIQAKENDKTTLNTL